MTTIAFTVVGIPIAWPRAKATAQIIRIAGKLKAVAKIYVPEDEDVKKWKHDIAFEARKAFHAAWPDWEDKLPLETPVQMTAIFVFPRPKYLIWKKKPMLRVPMKDVPDLDNLTKGVCDALNGVIYVDDRQVCELIVRKFYADGSEPPAVHVHLEEFEDAAVIPPTNQ